MRIFSYNISWESMTGNKSDWMLCSNNKDKTSDRHNSVCISNIASVINNNPADFVLLQEASNFKELILKNSVLESMNYEVHKSGNEQMVSFWNSKYKKIFVLKGEFEVGRPWMAIIYSNGLCVINIHMGHYTAEVVKRNLADIIKKITLKQKIIKTQKKSLNLLNKKVFQDTKKNKKNSIRVNRIVIGGDYNYDIKKLSKNLRLVLNNTSFYHHPKKILTCCIRRTTHFDHVLDSMKPPHDIFIPDVEYMASDHKPILVILE